MNAQPRMKTRRRRLRQVLVLAALAAVLGYVYWDLFLTTTIVSDDAYVSGNIIPVQARVPGIVVRVDADNTMMVREGQPLVAQEQNLARAHLDRAAAALAEAVRQVRSQMAQARQADREVATLTARREKTADDLHRYVEAEAGGAVSRQLVADTRAELAILDRQIAAAQGAYAKAQALVDRTDAHDNPLVLQKRADFVESHIQFHRANVAAPVDGFVANRRVEAGQQVVAGQLLMNVIPLRDLWVTANIKETDMPRVRPGQPVVLVSHGYGTGATYHGRVLGIEPAGGSTFSLFPPDNATGNYIHIVERVPVRISLDPAELARTPLRPGMSVGVAIDTLRNATAPVLHSDVVAQGASYATSLYAHELAAADAAADAIVAAN